MIILLLLFCLNLNGIRRNEPKLAITYDGVFVRMVLSVSEAVQTAEIY